MNAPRLTRLAILLASGLCVTAQSGPIFIAGRLDGNAFTPAANAATPCYSIRAGTLKAEIAGGIATVRLLEEVTGPAEALETVCIIPLPEEVTGEAATVTGVGADGLAAGTP